MKDASLYSSGKINKAFLVSGVLAVVACLALVVTLLAARQSSLQEETRIRLAKLQAGPLVRVVPVVRGEELDPISLVGEARAYATVTLYSKVSGFIKEIRVDKGDKVEANEVLAVVQSPELDRQYAGAVADAKNKRADAVRSWGLFKSGAVSPQSAEGAEAAARVAEENAGALKTQMDYQTIRAPFDGAITARYVDVGALVQSAANAQTTALPIVTLSESGRLRVYVYPDQSKAGFVRVGDRADISDPARPEAKLVGKVSRTSGELDPKTRTLLVEIDVDNREGRILAGSTAQVTLWLKAPPYVQVPAGAIVLRQDKPHVAVVSSDNRVRFRPVSIYDSNGKVVRVSSGLSEGEDIAVNMGAGVSEGDRVQPIRQESEKKRS